jgi:hypothetical protein
MWKSRDVVEEGSFTAEQMRKKGLVKRDCRG